MDPPKETTERTADTASVNEWAYRARRLATLLERSWPASMAAILVALLIIAAVK